MAPLNSTELLAHPEFQHVIWQLEPRSKGALPVAADRGGPFDLYYELHGSGPKHIVWIMGLGGLRTAWQRQTKDFGHDMSSEYTSLVFDNRGLGLSGKPTMRYSTSEMAKDVVDLFDHIGWTSSVHVVGVSMGGMIAQELTYLAPERIGSLTLVSTAARLKNTVGFFENLRNRINMFIPKNIDFQLDEVKHRLFPDSFLEAPDADGGFPTNGDRFAAQELKKRTNANEFQRKGFLLQAIAAGWHNKTPSQLKELGDKVGRERIQILHGTMDKMITFPHAEVLLHDLGGAESGVKFVAYEGSGHVLPMEKRKEFREAIEEMIGRTSSS